MTTKEIAGATGKDVSTVQRWIKKMNGKMQSIDGKMQSSNSTNPADFDLPETIAIIESGMGKNAANLYRMSATKQHLQNDKAPTQNAEVAQLGAMVANLAIMMQESMKMMLSQQNQITAILSQKTQLSIETKQAPRLSPRDELRMIVNKAAKESGDYSGAWKTLYTEIYYRLHINAQERAKNAKTTAIEILDSEGQLENAVSIAMEIF